MFITEGWPILVIGLDLLLVVATALQLNFEFLKNTYTYTDADAQHDVSYAGYPHAALKFCLPQIVFLTHTRLYTAPTTGALRLAVHERRQQRRLQN